MKQIKLLTSLVLLLVFSSTVIGQSDATNLEKNGLPLRIAYYGDNGINPGLRVGTSHTFHENVKVRTYKSKKKQAKKGAKTKVIQYKLDGNLGFYNQPNNHAGLLVGAGITRHRNKNEKRFSTALSFEVNYLQRFYNINTFEIDENGSINELGLAGNGGLMFALAPTFERKFGAKELNVFVKPALQAVKYNHSFVLSAAIEFGVTLNLFK